LKDSYKRSVKFEKKGYDSKVYKWVNRFGGKGLITKGAGAIAMIVFIAVMVAIFIPIMYNPALLFVPVFVAIAVFVALVVLLMEMYGRAAAVDSRMGFKYAENSTYGPRKESSDKEKAAFFRIADEGNVKTWIVGRQRNEEKEDALIEKIENLNIDSNFNESHRDANDGKTREIGDELKEIKKSTKIISLPLSDSPNALPNDNVSIIGGSGTGKTFMILIGNAIVSGRIGESVFFTDPSGQLYNMLSKYYEILGYDVKVFNTVNMQCSDSWDFMQEISYGDPDKVTEKANLASNIILQALASEAKKSEGFWDNQNMNLLYGLVLYVATSPIYTGERSYQGVLKVLAEEVMESIDDGRGNKVYLFDEKVRRISPEDYCKEPLMMFMNSSKAAREGVPGGLYVKLARFGARKILSNPEISTISVGQRRTALFLISSDQNSTYDVLITLLTSFLFVNLATLAQKQRDTRLPVTTRFYLDEFPNIGQIPDFQKKSCNYEKIWYAYGVNHAGHTADQGDIPVHMAVNIRKLRVSAVHGSTSTGRRNTEIHI